VSTFRILQRFGRKTTCQELIFQNITPTNWLLREAGIPIRSRTPKSSSQSIRKLATKGFTRTDSDKADLFVAYQVAVDQEKQWNASGMGGGVRWGGMGTATSSTISVGTLALELYDPAAKQLVRKGSATKTLQHAESNRSSRINRRLQFVHGRY